MSQYGTVRGKITALGGITLAVHDDGALHISVNGSSDLPGQQGRVLELSEDEAQRLYSLMGDVLEWEHSGGTTEATMNKMGEADDRQHESGELNHIIEHGPK